jgi:hypothetical protein
MKFKFSYEIPQSSGVDPHRNRRVLQMDSILESIWKIFAGNGIRGNGPRRNGPRGNENTGNRTISDIFCFFFLLWTPQICWAFIYNRICIQKHKLILYFFLNLSTSLMCLLWNSIYFVSHPFLWIKFIGLSCENWQTFHFNFFFLALPMVLQVVSIFVFLYLNCCASWKKI